MINRSFLRRLSSCLLVAASLATLTPTAKAGKPKPPPPHWVGTWAAAPYALDSTKTVASTGFGTSDETLRQIVRPTLAGPLVRVVFTNEFGIEPLIIGSAHIAVAAPGGEIVLPSANALTFNGSPTITIPAGALVVSDPAALAVTAGTDLAVSIFLPAQKLTKPTWHGSAYATSYIAPGNVVGQKSLPKEGLKTVTNWFFLKGVDVKVPGPGGAIVALGDSITDGTGSKLDAHSRWTDVLSQRLQANKQTSDLSVLDEGIGGNRILHQQAGPSALSRFDRDVLSQAGVQYLIILEGINDIGHAYDTRKPFDMVTADDIIQGLTQLVARAHEHSIKVIGATLTPYMGAGYSSPAGEAVRQAVNTWIRTSKSLDGVIDFDKATQNPANPAAFRPDFQIGDHLHPNDAGYKAMGDAIDLKLFNPNPKESYDIKVVK